MGAIELSEADLWPRTTVEQGFILRTVSADGLLGIVNRSSLQEIAIWIEPPESALGLRDVDRSTRGGETGEANGGFDVTVEVYGLRRWCRAAMAGSLEMLLPLYAPDDQVLLCTDAGRELRSQKDAFLSCGHRERLFREVAAARDRLAALGLPTSPALRRLIEDLDINALRIQEPSADLLLEQWMVRTYRDHWDETWRPGGLE